MIVFDSLENFMPSKLMPEKSNHDFKENYPVGTLGPICITDILKKKQPIFAIRQSFIIRVRHMMT